MNIIESADQLDVQWDKPEQIFTGAWFAGLSIISLIFTLTLVILGELPEFPLLAIVAMLLFGGVGGLFVLTATRQHTTIRKTDVTIKTTSYFTKRTTSQTYPTADITAIDYFEFVGPKRDNGSEVSLTMQDGSRIKILRQRMFHIWFSHKPAGPLKDSADQIARFLNVPVSVPASNEMRPLDR